MFSYSFDSCCPILNRTFLIRRGALNPSKFSNFDFNAVILVLQKWDVARPSRRCGRVAEWQTRVA
jgi:hypothetical protein